MGQSPAVVIVARHGARLDAADKQWHLTSPTPYDPPLTYGGWKQAQALGTRIANILKLRETTLNSSLENGVLKNPGLATLDGPEKKEGGRKSNHLKRRRQKVVLHTSPFLRCIQTSIAISAGLEQHEGSPKSHSRSSNPKPHSHPMHSGSSYLRAMDQWSSPLLLSAVPEPEEKVAGTLPNSRPKSQSTKPLLRVDAFLGEWLSPDYFEMITPPPNSVMMVASAKADLLRPGEHVEILPTNTLNRGNFPGGWGSERSRSRTGSLEDDEDGPLANMSDISHSLPKFNRSNSHSGAGPLGIRSHQNTASVNGNVVSGAEGYISPTPAYAISPADPIPPGYVAHARDACVEVDYQWDSMRLPHDWGDGGSIGEEWSSMHKRFRRGLHSMIDWYRNCDVRARDDRAIRGPGGRATRDDEDASETDGAEAIETVLVLVTHGAGCNALIGALTNQPVLLDVGMASLTMAIRKPTLSASSSTSSSSSSSSSFSFSSRDSSLLPASLRRRSTTDLNLPIDYEIKLLASTEHLRTPSPAHRSASSLPTLKSSSSSSSSNNNSPYRYRSVSSAVSTASRTSSASDASFTLDQSAMPIGLWTKPVPLPHAAELSRTTPSRNALEKSRIIPISNPRPTANQADSSPAPLKKNPYHHLPCQIEEDGHPEGGVDGGKDEEGEGEEGNDFVAQRGLWGAPPVPMALAMATARERGQKRRWTCSEQR